MLLNINATRAFILCFFTILNQNEFRIATVAMFTCDLYAGSPPPHDLERLCTTMQRRVVDFVRVGYFIPLNGPLNGHPPSTVLMETNININAVTKIENSRGDDSW